MMSVDASTRAESRSRRSRERRARRWPASAGTVAATSASAHAARTIRRRTRLREPFLKVMGAAANREFRRVHSPRAPFVPRSSIEDGFRKKIAFEKTRTDSLAHDGCRVATIRLRSALVSERLPTDTANMLAFPAGSACRVSDTRQNGPIYVDLETGQEIGRLRSSVATTPKAVLSRRAPDLRCQRSPAAARPNRRSRRRRRARSRVAAGRSWRRFDRSPRPTTGTLPRARRRRPTW